MANFEVNWSGGRYSLCCGEWTIRRNGVDVSDLIPENLRNHHMNTRKEYSAWHFTEDWDEEWEDDDTIILDDWDAGTVSDEMLNRFNNSSNYGVRPVVSLQSNINLEYNSTSEEWEFLE